MSKSVKNDESLKPSKYRVDELKCKNAIFRNIWEIKKSPKFQPLREAKLKMVGT